MQINKLTKQQCKRIIDNNYLGAYDRKGRQTDYHDFAADIRARYYDLCDRSVREPVDEPEWVTEGVPLVDAVKIFNKWRYISMQLMGDVL
jgi:hypothetical protein